MSSTYVASSAGHSQLGSESVLFVQEDLTPETTKKVLEAFAKGQKPKPGPQSGRHTSENSAGLTALTSKVCLLCWPPVYPLTPHSLAAIWPG